MSIQILGKSDHELRLIQEALSKYQADHEQACIELYRRNAVTIRVRIIDPLFSGMDLVSRDNLVWKYLDGLPDEIQTDITMLILLTQKESTHSLVNQEFELSLTRS